MNVRVNSALLIKVGIFSCLGAALALTSFVSSRNITAAKRNAARVVTPSKDAAVSSDSSVQLIRPSEVGHVPIPASYFGMTVLHLNLGWPSVPFGALGKNGAPGEWISVEKRKGQFDWREIDRYAEAAEGHGMGFFFSSGFVPEWAAAEKSSCRQANFDREVSMCTSMVANIRDWDNFVTALVTRYKGRIHIYDLWNEPWNQNIFTSSVPDMATLTTHMHDIIRSIDPSAVIVAPAPTPHRWLDGYLAAGGVRSADVYSVHGYTTNMDLDTAEVSQAWKSEPLKAILARYGLADKPIWDTEGSWGNQGRRAIKDPDLQAAFVARAYLLHWAAGITRYYWYAWDEPNWGTLWDRQTGLRKPGVAYGQVYNWMVGATMTRLCEERGGDTWNCEFSRPGGYAAEAVWNTSGGKSYSVPSKFTQFRDLDGNIVKVSSGSVEIGLKPILLENSSPR
jgi:polysaccharide biosynthesis protein PslG